MKELKSIFRRALTFTLFLVIGLAVAQAQATLTPFYGTDGTDPRADFHLAVSAIPIENWDEYSSGHKIYNGDTLNGITYKYVPDRLLPGDIQFFSGNRCIPCLFRFQHLGDKRLLPGLATK